MNPAMELILQQLSAEPLGAGSSKVNDTLANLAKLHGRVDQAFRNERELFLLRALIDQIPDFLFVKDRAGKFVIANEAVARAYGLQVGGLVGKCDHDLHPLALADEFSKCEQEIMASGLPRFNMQESFPNSEGVLKWYSTTKVPLRDDLEGVTVGLIGIARDVTERRQMEKQLVHMAHYDSLTQLPNRILFVDHLRAALSERRVRNSKVALLYIDLDGFKKVNDTLGHQLGDVLLQKVSDRLREAAKKADTVARLGGDEFAAIQVLGANSDAIRPPIPI
jgi:PAS domain S-box-containing protein